VRRDSPQQRLLDEVGRIELAPQAGIKPGPGQRLQIIAELFLRPGEMEVIGPRARPIGDRDGASSDGLGSRSPLAANLARRSIAVVFDQPLLIVQQPELPERLDQLGDDSERPHPKEILFERSDIRCRSVYAFSTAPIAAPRSGAPSASSIPRELLVLGS
jgi:hypothetical protein